MVKTFLTGKWCIGCDLLIGHQERDSTTTWPSTTCHMQRLSLTSTTSAATRSPSLRWPRTCIMMDFIGPTLSTTSWGCSVTKVSFWRCTHKTLMGWSEVIVHCMYIMFLMSPSIVTRRNFHCAILIFYRKNLFFWQKMWVNHSNYWESSSNE